MEGADRTVVIAYDGSPAARQAVADTAGLLGSCRVLVVTVWEEGLAYETAAMPPDGMMNTPMVDPGVAKTVDHAVHERAERISADGAKLANSLGLDAEPLAIPDEGDVAGTLLSVADERSASAIVVGSRGLSGLRARLEGSTSKGLLKHAKCPVVVVHERDHDEG